MEHLAQRIVLGLAIAAPGTATVEYFDDITSAPPLAGMGGEPYALRWQIWLTVPVTDTYAFAVYADDGFSFSGYGLVMTNSTAQVAITKESALGLTLYPGVPYNFSLTYLNYSPTTTGVVQLLWRRAGGSLEIVPVEALHARTRREYYSFGGTIVAMKEGVLSGGTVRTLTYLHGDHPSFLRASLGSASLATSSSGTIVSQMRYTPYGELRWTSGADMPTDKRFTGQIAHSAGYVGSLYDYSARFYSPALGRFVSADTIVPGAVSSQALNRYMYVGGNPLRYVDPSGHVEASPDDNGCGASWCVSEESSAEAAVTQAAWQATIPNFAVAGSTQSNSGFSIQSDYGQYD